MKPQELVDMLLAACGESFQFDCNTALEAVDVIRDVMDDLDALNLILKANKEMLKSETARADKAEQQRDELLTVLEGLTEDIQGLIDESTGVVGLHLNGNIATWGELEAGGAFEWLTNLPAAHETIAKAKGGA